MRIDITTRLLAGAALFCTAADPACAEGFSQTFALNGITFNVEASAKGSLSTLTITPTGLEVTNEPVTQEIDGTVTGAEIGDAGARSGRPAAWAHIRLNLGRTLTMPVRRKVQGGWLTGRDR